MTDTPIRFATPAAALTAAAACLLASAAVADDASPRQFTFSYPFTADDAMRPRGGTSRGTPVDLADGPTEAWQALREDGLDRFERDRRAILAMAGPYRASFDFVETVRFVPDADVQRPYQSWGTEYVYVAEDAGDFISLQHIMVMFFEDDDGGVTGPVVMKHWRQDWRYEDREINAYVGEFTWQTRRLDAAAVEGAWSQAVYQVDDAPRYENVGRWTHAPGYSAWTGDVTWRPLPRREYSVRDDYDVLAGTNRHTIVPTGWVHEQDNLKLVLDAPGEPADTQRYVARELGVNRYERIEGFDFSAGDAYWRRTSAFWDDVRAAWDDILAGQARYALAAERDGRSLFEHLFGYAERIESADDYDRSAALDFIERTVGAYVEPSPAR